MVHFDTWATEGTSEAGEAAKAEKLFSVIVKAREAHEGAAGSTSVFLDLCFAVQFSLYRFWGRISVMHYMDCSAGGGEESNTAEKSAEQLSTAHHQNIPEASADEGGFSCNPKVPSCRGRRRMRKYGQFIFVDLAGSERLKATGTQGAVGVSESCAINRSLFALGRVLNAVSETSQGRQQKV